MSNSIMLTLYPTDMSGLSCALLSYVGSWVLIYFYQQTCVVAST